MAAVTSETHCSSHTCCGCGASSVSRRHIRLLPASVGAVIGGYVPSLLNIANESLSDLVSVMGIVLGIVVAVIAIRVTGLLQHTSDS